MTAPSNGPTIGAPDRFVSNAPKLGFVPPFDGFRGIAVVLVVVVHGWAEELAGFAPLVDVFFIISGFLITTLLLQEDRQTGGIDLREFFRRRVIRLFPVMYTVLAGTLVFGLLVGDATFREQVLSDVGAAAIYMYHVIHPVNEAVLGCAQGITELADSGRCIPAPRPLIHLWSLSVEEHFYLFGALVTVLAIRFNKVKLLIGAFVAFWAFVAVARALGHVGWNMMWYQRPDAIAIGVAMAYFNGLLPKELSEKAVHNLRWLGGLGFFLLMFAMLSGTTLLKPLGLYVASFPSPGEDVSSQFLWGRYGYSMANFGAALMVLALVRGGNWWLARGMSGKLAGAFGRRSYTIYLLHIPLAMILIEGSKDRNDMIKGLAGLAYLPALAVSTELVHRYIEMAAVKKFRKAPMAARGQS